MLNIPNSIPTTGTYPSGQSWAAYTFDEGKAALVIDKVGPSPRLEVVALGRQGYIKDLSSLGYSLVSLDRSEYPELMAWCDAHFSPEDFEVMVKKHYYFSHPSWRALYPEAPIENLQELGVFLSSTEKLDDGLENIHLSYERETGCEKHLHIIFFSKGMVPILLVYSEMENWCEYTTEVTPIKKIEDLRKLMAEDSWTKRMLQRNLSRYWDIERRINQ